jgi:hypothetical protein
MDEKILNKVIAFYGFRQAVLSNIHSGLINNTWKVIDGKSEFILQKINVGIFKKPQMIDDNLKLLSDHFQQYYPEYLFVAPIKGIHGATMFQLEGDYFRCFPFIKDSHTINVVETPGQAFEAAFQFGKFTALLNKLDVSQLKITLPDFHNLVLRFQQFEEAVMKGNSERVAETKAEIDFLFEQKPVLGRFERFIKHPDARIRVTHHDTKISNVLFDATDKGLCVIDLDTVMPGYFFSDAGDMMRTYICPVSEEENDLNKIIVRKDFLLAIKEGYFTAMGNELTLFEKEHFLFSGEVLIYMQALRFLTDYLNNDIYYGCKYPKHNLVRAANQIKLLQEYQLAIL